MKERTYPQGQGGAGDKHHHGQGIDPSKRHPTREGVPPHPRQERGEDVGNVVLARRGKVDGGEDEEGEEEEEEEEAEGAAVVGVVEAGVGGGGGEGGRGERGGFRRLHGQGVGGGAGGGGHCGVRGPVGVVIGWVGGR